MTQQASPTAAVGARPLPRSFGRRVKDVLLYILHRLPVPLQLAIAEAYRRYAVQLLHALRGNGSYRRWVRLYDRLDEADRRAIAADIAGFARTPLISVAMPVCDPPEAYLREAIASVTGQLYPHWELCIADDASTAPHVGALLAEYAAGDPRIRIVRRGERGGIAAATNSALDLAGGEFVALLDHDDVLPEHALYLVAREIVLHPEADLIYSDEDKLDRKGRRCDPYFKSGWNPDLLLSQNTISHLGVYRTALVRELGGMRSEFDGSQDYDLALRVARASRPGAIRHIPHVLYHWRQRGGALGLAPPRWRRRRSLMPSRPHAGPWKTICAAAASPPRSALPAAPRFSKCATGWRASPESASSSRPATTPTCSNAASPAFSTAPITATSKCWWSTTGAANRTPSPISHGSAATPGCGSYLTTGRSIFRRSTTGRRRRRTATSWCCSTTTPR
jgi:hypothetical protein